MLTASDFKTACDYLYQRWLANSNPKTWAMCGIVFCRPELELAKSVLTSLKYYHARSANYVDFYFAGFSQCRVPDSRQCISGTNNRNWWFSDSDFVRWQHDLERVVKWSYSGGCELILLNFGCGDHYSEPRLDASKIIVINLDEVANEAPVAVSGLFERIFKYSEKLRPSDPISGFSDQETNNSLFNRSSLIEYLTDWMPEAIKKRLRSTQITLVKNGLAEENQEIFLNPDFPKGHIRHELQRRSEQKKAMQDHIDQPELPL